MHCTAPGEIALVGDDLTGLPVRLTAYTPATITAVARLRAELASVRKYGVAFDRGEWYSGCHGGGAPVWTRSASRVRPAASITGGQFLASTFTTVMSRHTIPPGGQTPPSRYDPHDAIYAAADDELFAHERTVTATEVRARRLTLRVGHPP